MHIRVRLLMAAILVGLPTVAFGLAGEHPNNQPVGGNDKWPAGLKELVNRPERVYGYFVNWQDFFFFAGDSRKLHEFVKGYAKLPETKLQIVLHPGKSNIKRIIDQQQPAVAADWSLYTTPFAPEQLKDGKIEPGPFVTKLDIWTGGQVDFAKLLLILPAGVPVEAGDDSTGDDKEKIENLLRKLRAKHAAGRVAPGLYKIATDNDGHGVRMERNDSSGSVTLAERVAVKFGTAFIVSENNDNSRFRLSLTGAGPIPQGADQGHLAIVIADYCTMVSGHYDRRADGTIDLYATIVGRRAADQIASELKITPKLRTHPGHLWAVSLRPEKDAYHVGEPIALEMNIKNVGQTTIAFIDGGMQRGPRNNQFQFTAFRTHGHGIAVPDTGDPMHHGGLGGFIRIEPGKTFTKSVKLSDWFKFDKPDTYRVTGLYRVALDVGEQRGAWDDFAVGECLVTVVAGEGPAADHGEGKRAAAP